MGHHRDQGQHGQHEPGHGQHGQHGHHRHDRPAVRCRVIVVSDTRTLETDEAGKLIVARLEGAGHRVLGREVVTDELALLRGRVLEICEEESTEALILTGGTGLGHRDVTPEALEPLLLRTISGFGETLRRISFDEIGPRGLLSRALAGVVDHTVVFALPGSAAACATAMDRLVLDLLPHAVGLVRSR